MRLVAGAALCAGLGLLLACAAPAAPVAAPTPNAVALAEATVAALRATRTVEDAGATQTARREATAAVRAAETATAETARAEAASAAQAARAQTVELARQTAEAEREALLAAGDPASPYGLVDQRLRVCVAGTLPLESVVERVEVAPYGDGMRVLLVVQTTNVGRAPGGSTRASKLMDERGREFDQTLFGAVGLDPVGTQRQYGLNAHLQGIAPGATAREAWPFLVTPDVQRLAIVPARLHTCRDAQVSARPPTAADTSTGSRRNTPTPLPTPFGAGQGTLADALVGQPFRFCTGADRVPFDAVIERADVRPHASGGQLVVLVTAVKNVGTKSAMPTGGTKLQDARGRLFDQAGVSQSVNAGALADEYGGDHEARAVQPGFASRPVWAYVVAPDARALMVIAAGPWSCDA